jgi:hypothetical protein
MFQLSVILTGKRKCMYCRLGGVMVSMLVIGSKVRGFEPDLGDGLLRTIKINSTPFFGGEVKPETTCRKILRHVKTTCKYE